MPDLDPSADNLLLPFQLAAGAIRGRVIRLGDALDHILARHDYPLPVASLLGESVVLAASLAGMLKYEGIFTLQIQGDGPVALVVADVTSAGGLRAYARFDAERVAAVPPGAAPVPGLLGQGYLAFTVDQGPHTDRYQGIVELAGTSLTDCADQYFRQSEQLQTAIRLAVGRHGADGWRAGALMLQRMPIGPRAPILTADQAEEGWRTAVILLASLTEGELLAPSLPAATLLYRLFHAEGLVAFAPHALQDRCRCSLARVETTLRSFPRTEIESLSEDDGLVSVVCEFCKARYEFDTAALDALYAEGR